MSEKQRKKKRKKRSRFGLYLYAFVALILAIANILVFTFVLTFVQKIDVLGTQYTTEEEFVNEIKSDPYTINSIYTIWKYHSKGFDFPSIVESVTLKAKTPWQIVITVDEKDIVGCVLINGEYVYFSEDQTVITKSTDMIEGINDFSVPVRKAGRCG